MTKTFYLGIDTSSGWSSLGLVDAAGLVASATLRAKESRAQGFVARVRSFLAEGGAGPEELAGIGVAIGPGSFTALRVGVSTAQGLAMGLGIPLVPVETPEAAIRSVPAAASPALVVVPARKGEVFAQTFTFQPGIGWISRDMIECLKVEELHKALESPALIAGPALASYGEEIAAAFENRIPLAPAGSWVIRGESVAFLARERLRSGDSNFAPGDVAIRYLQSHGALTIAERKKAAAKKQ